MMKNFFEKVKANKKQLSIYLLIVVLGFILCGPFLRFHLATDSFNMLLDTSSFSNVMASISGRPVSDLVLFYTNVIGFNMMTNQQFYSFISIIIMIIATILLYKTAMDITNSKEKSSWIVAIASLFIIFNIFGFEMFLFNVMFSLSIQYLIVVYSVKIILKEFNFKNVIISILLNLIGLCIYQAISPIFLGIAVILFGYKYKDKSFWKNILNYIYIGLIYGAACIGNLLIIKLAPINRYDNTNNIIKNNITNLIDRQKFLWINTFDFFPKYFFLGITGILMIVLIALIIKYNRKNFIKIVSSILIATVLVTIGAFIPHIVSNTSILPRTGLAISCIPGLILLCIGIYFIDEINKYIKIFIVTLIFIYLLLATNASCLLVNKLVLSNKVDLMNCNQIMNIINEYEEKNGSTVENLAFVYDADGMTWENDYNTVFSGMDVYMRAFITPWSRANIFEYYHNRKFNQVEPNEEITKTYFDGKGWNKFDKEQVVIIEDTAYIVIY